MKRTYPYYEVLFGPRKWGFRICATHRTTFESDWSYATGTSCKAAAKRWLKVFKRGLGL